MPDQGSVSYTRADEGYFEKRGLRWHAGVLQLWTMGERARGGRIARRNNREAGVGRAAVVAGELRGFRRPERLRRGTVVPRFGGDHVDRAGGIVGFLDRGDPAARFRALCARRGSATG